jgi:hypothetical protein
LTEASVHVGRQRLSLLCRSRLLLLLLLRLIDLQTKQLAVERPSVER